MSSYDLASLSYFSLKRNRIGGNEDLLRRTLEEIFPKSIASIYFYYKKITQKNSGTVIFPKAEVTHAFKIKDSDLILKLLNLPFNFDKSKEILGKHLVRALALKEGYSTMIQLLLDKGADVNQKDGNKKLLFI